MKSLTIRNIPDQVYEKLTGLARRNKRSLQKQIQMVLERESRLGETSCISEARVLRDRFSGREWGDIVKDIRKERER